jgi:hypothetical protein
MLPTSLQNKLANLPEHGMDYQVCDVTLKDGTTLKDVVVTGCRMCQFNRQQCIVGQDIADVNLSTTWARGQPTLTYP